jgi:Xaa-Pro aminopeptidase
MKINIDLQSEYVSQRDSRVEFISGFTGSNAYAVITRDQALLWTDNRYFIQARTTCQKYFNFYDNF